MFVKIYEKLATNKTSMGSLKDIVILRLNFSNNNVQI